VRVLRGAYPIAVSLMLISAVTVILWQVKLSTSGLHHLVYFYLLPVVLIAFLYNSGLAMLSAAIALICADLFLQDPIYSLANDNPLEYGDLVWFALLAVMASKFIQGLAWPRTRTLEARSRYRRV